MFVPAIAILLVITIGLSGWLLLQGIREEHRRRLRLKRQAIADLAMKTGAYLTPHSVADALRISRLEADKLLRGLVDEDHVRMAVDDREATLKFWFTNLRTEPEDERARPVGKSDNQRPFRRRTTSKNPRIDRNTTITRGPPES
ncbi:MAG: hypothetical protein IPK13_18310 [Deltaproteobacteria bacterium]|nr:hypothetical protein [Deltaproteobacteria bacterium]